MKYITLLFLLVFTVNLKAQSVEPFHDGDRVAYVGDSITEMGYYESYIWLYYMTHFPNRRIRIFNDGIGGDTAWLINKRMQDDAFSEHPSIIALTFGMNDTGYQLFYNDKADSLAKARVDSSYNAYKKIERKLKNHPDIQKVLIASSPYDETAKIDAQVFPHKNEYMRKVADFLHKAANNNNWGYVDFGAPMTAINQREQKTDSSFTLNGTGRIHPGNDGHMVMAYLFLKAQGLAGKKVASTEINANTGKAVKAENATISDVQASPDKIGFTYLAHALPFPVDTTAHGWGIKDAPSVALDVIPFTKEFNQELMQVDGLKSHQKYSLMIDGVTIGEWNGTQLGDGINLATQKKTPQYQQAHAIMHLNQRRMEVENKLREYYWAQFNFFREHNMLFEDTAAAVDSLEKYAKSNIFLKSKEATYQLVRFSSVKKAWEHEMDVLIDQIYKTNQPKEHTVVIQPA